MTTLSMTLAGAAAAALMAAIGAAVAQTPVEDSQATPQTSADVAPNSLQIYHFKDQGNSPETDPSAHLLLIRHGSPYQASTTVETSQMVADATPAQPAPAPSTYDSSTTSTTTTDRYSASTDNSAAMPAPKADRN